MQQDFVILKRARERETKRLLRVILSRVNYAKKAKGAINHFGSTQFKSDSHFDFPCSWIKNWSHCLTIYHAAEFSPYGMDDKTKTSSFNHRPILYSSSFHQPVHFSWTTLQAIFWAISSAAAACFWWWKRRWIQKIHSYNIRCCEQILKHFNYYNTYFVKYHFAFI